MQTDAHKEVKKNYCRWSRRFDQQSFRTSCSSIEELGRVYVSLMDGEKAVCFWRGRAAEFTDLNPKMKWIPL